MRATSSDNDRSLRMLRVVTKWEKRKEENFENDEEEEKEENVPRQHRCLNLCKLSNLTDQCML